MRLRRLYDNWNQVRAAAGSAGSRQRRAWRDVLAPRPAIAYWGDSWFSTPLYPNLHWNSFVRIDGMAIRLGGPGRTAARMLTARACRDTATRLRMFEFDLLCVSVGGNDCLGPRLARVFDGVAPMDAAAAFARVLEDGMLDRVRERYRVLLDAVAASGADVRVVGQGYAPPAVAAIGRRGAVDIKNLGLVAPLVRNVGPWLWPAVRATFEDDRAEAARFARLLLVEGFRDRVLAPTRTRFGGLFSFADFSGLAEPADGAFWYDEIHPTAAGFALLATGFNAMLRAALPARKRDAVGLA